ncbi:hypothetical protein ARMSODRAFT_968551 [Armillaria solidipes]|uniref:Uncharacterized protein n=1 Tax=Armillaria solidipes TaxID=1076256 RepID=A0A2H3CAR9_9AGAR|nr:hypothetical protein ARMSODRAFT_968551 [Armillaria solidipes]
MIDIEVSDCLSAGPRKYYIIERKNDELGIAIFCNSPRRAIAPGKCCQPCDSWREYGGNVRALGDSEALDLDDKSESSWWSIDVKGSPDRRPLRGWRVTCTRARVRNDAIIGRSAGYGCRGKFVDQAHILRPARKILFRARTTTVKTFDVDGEALK